MNTRRVTVLPQPVSPPVVPRANPVVQALPVTTARAVEPPVTLGENLEPSAAEACAERRSDWLPTLVTLLGHLAGGLAGLIAGYVILRYFRPEQAEQILRQFL